MNFDDYEALPNSKLSITLFAGACAGIMEHVVMYPVDTIKVSSIINFIINIAIEYLENFYWITSSEKVRSEECMQRVKK